MKKYIIRFMSVLLGAGALIACESLKLGDEGLRPSA